jgi:hypothetical protein
MGKKIGEKYCAIKVKFVILLKSVSNRAAKYYKTYKN